MYDYLCIECIFRTRIAFKKLLRTALLASDIMHNEGWAINTKAVKHNIYNKSWAF